MSDSPAGDEGGTIDVLKLTYDGSEFEISLAPDFLDDPHGWGELLAEIARSVARSSEEVPEEEMLAAIHSAFNEALAQPPEATS